MKIADVWRMFRQNILLVLLLAFVGAVIGYVIAKTGHRVYSAVATVELNKDFTPGIGFQDLSGVASQIGVGSEFLTDLLTHQAVLDNDNTALTVIERLKLQERAPYNVIPDGKYRADFLEERGRPLEQAPLTRGRDLVIFHKGLNVSVVKNTRLLDVTYTDADPMLAAEIANTVVDAYLNNTTELRFEATAKTSTWLQGQLDELKRRSQESHDKASDFEQKTGLSDVGALAPDIIRPNSQDTGSAASKSPVYQRLLSLNESLTRAQVTRIAKEAIYRLTDTTNPDVIMSLAESSLGSEGRTPGETKEIGLLAGLREQEAGLKVRLAAEQVKYGAKSPSIVELRDQITSVDQQMATEVANIHKDAEVAYRLARSDEEALRQRVDEQQAKMTTLGNNITQLNFLQEEERTSRTLYEDLYTRLEQAKVAAGVKSSDIVLVNPARAPGTPSSPVTMTNVIGGFAVGFSLGILLAVYRTLRETGLSTPDQIGALWDIALLGVVPRFPLAAQQKRFTIQRPEDVESDAWLLRAPRSYIAEAYRSIRTALTVDGRRSPRRVLMFGGGLAGAGTSTTAYNMAVALAAQSPLRVLLIDADFRHPAVARLAGCEAGPGLSEVLQRDDAKVLISNIVQQHPEIASLSIIAAGQSLMPPAELLASDRLKALIEAMRSRFDYILIDAPPMLLVTDAALIAQHVDGVVLVFSSGTTAKTSVERLHRMLERQNAITLGYVLNRYDDSEHDSGYPVYADNAYYEELEKQRRA